MVFGLVPEALELRNLSSKSFVNFCEHFEARAVASLERLELSTHCLEGSCSVRLSYRDADYCSPPLTAMIWPVTYSPSSEARNTAKLPMS